MSTPDSHTLPPGIRVSEYEIHSVLGEGGFGITYLATDVNLKIKVAIKEYFPGGLASRDSTHTVKPYTGTRMEGYELGLKSFIKEARLLAQLRHPNIVSVRRYFEDNGTAYIVMEYVEGMTLHSKLDQIGKMTQEEIRAVFLPLLDGLKLAHSAGILHRDIKPENILITNQGVPILIDFGAAKQQTGERAKQHSTFQSVTDGFSPLEQYSASNKVGPWSDIYALSVSVYYSMTLNKIPAVTDRVLEDKVAPLSQLYAADNGFDNSLLLTVDRGMSIQLADRQQTVDEYISGFAEVVQENNNRLGGRQAPAQPTTGGQPQPNKQDVTPTQPLPEAGQEKPGKDKPQQQGAGESGGQPQGDNKTPRKSSTWPYWVFGILLIGVLAIGFGPQLLEEDEIEPFDTSSNETEETRQQDSQNQDSESQQDTSQQTKPKKKKVLTPAEQFLEDNKGKNGVVATRSGLQYRVLRQGSASGGRPASTDTVSVKYQGTLINGTIFDSSDKTVKFELPKVIKGWQEGLPLMRKNAKYQFFVPPELGFGGNQRGNIPPDSVLIFEVELVDFSTTRKKAGSSKKQTSATQSSRSQSSTQTSNNAQLSPAERFMRQNKTKPGVLATASGLQYQVLKRGSGSAKPKSTDTVTVHYKGTLTDGTEFDSSIKRGERVSFPLDKVIKGWTEGLQLMRRGDKFKFFIPPELGYGERGSGSTIPANAVLIFEVELFDFKSS